MFQLDKDGKGSISLYDYFGMFESHGIEVTQVEYSTVQYSTVQYSTVQYSIEVTQVETRRVVKLAGEDGMLTKENFFKIVQGSDFFLKSFDKNNDGEVTEVGRRNIKNIFTG